MATVGGRINKRIPGLTRNAAFEGAFETFVAVIRAFERKVIQKNNKAVIGDRGQQGSELGQVIEVFFMDFYQMQLGAKLGADFLENGFYQTAFPGAASAP